MSIMGTFCEYVCTFMIISCWIPCKMRNVSDTNFSERIKTHILFPVTFFWKSWHAWDNAEKYGRARLVTDDSKYSTVSLHAG
jgi:hypothetical protein